MSNISIGDRRDTAQPAKRPARKATGICEILNDALIQLLTDRVCWQVEGDESHPIVLSVHRRGKDDVITAKLAVRDDVNRQKINALGACGWTMVYSETANPSPRTTGSSDVVTIQAERHWSVGSLEVDVPTIAEQLHQTIILITPHSKAIKVGLVSSLPATMQAFA